MAPKSAASPSRTNPSTSKSSNSPTPPAPSPTRPAAGSERFIGKLRDVRTNLVKNIEQSWYLAEDGGRDRVAWYRMGKENVLLTKESAAALNTEHAKHASQEEDDTASEAAGMAPSPAILSAVVTVTPEDFWMISCGRWKGPTNVCREFADMKLSCTGAAPEDDVFQADFPKVISNINHLMATSATRGFTLKKGVLMPSGTTQKIKFRHVLFEPLADPNTEGEEEEGDMSEEIPEAFKIQNWPTINDEAQSALQEMIATHHVIPIPAYDIHGRLILPSQYKKQLEGATVQVHFTLKHWSIGGRNGVASADTYVADVVSMRVLIPPKAPFSPTKRRFFATDPMSSPTKKNRT